MSEVSIWLSGSAARAESIRFCFAVSGWPRSRFTLTSAFLSAFEFLVAVGIHGPFPRCCFSSGNDSNKFVALIRVNHEKDAEVVHHSNGVPTLLTFHFTILKSHLKRIVKNDNRSLEVDAMLSRVGPVLSRVPGKFLNCPAIFVYTIAY
jgi:hypothetical protein